MKIPVTPSRTRGFTLIEVVLSVAVLAIGFTSVLLCLSYASSLSSESAGKGQAISILRNAFSDIRTAQNGGFQKSPQFDVKAPNADDDERRELLWFDEDGQQVAEQRDASYRCVITFHADPIHPELLHLHGRVAWPAQAKEGREAHQMELLTSLRTP